MNCEESQEKNNYDDELQRRNNPTLTNPEWQYQFLDSEREKEISERGNIQEYMKMIQSKEDSICVFDKRKEKLSPAEQQLSYINMLPIPKKVRENILISLIN